MEPFLMDPTATSAVPAPFWFIQLFKILGFTLHCVPMNLWYAGIPVAMLLRIAGGAQGRQVSGRLMAQMPVLIAVGINFGIVPLLFVQLAYPQFFYSATILMAWYWFAVILLLIPAYYGVYLYASGLPDEAGRMTRLKQAAGCGAAVLFLAIGFLFANAFSLMGNVGAWHALWKSTNTGGAALGTALNTADPTLWPRWLMMFALALMTTSVWIVVDAAWFMHNADDERQRWIGGFAGKLFTAGLLGFAVTGTWYVFGTWPTELRQTMFRGPLLVLTILTAVSPGLPWILFLLRRGKHAAITRRFSVLLALGQVGVLAANATSRQVVQNVELRRYMHGWGEAVQWSPLVVFLVVLAGGMSVVLWMLTQALAPRQIPN